MKVSRFVRELTVENKDGSKNDYSLVYVDAEGEFLSSHVVEASAVSIEPFDRERAGYQYLENLVILMNEAL